MRNSIQAVCNHELIKLKNILHSNKDIGSVVSCDWLTQTISGRRFNEFAVLFIKEEWGQEPSLKSKVLFLAPSDGNTSEAIRQLQKDTLYATMGLNLYLMMKRFTFLTDSAAVMQTVVGSSTSATLMGRYETWSPCAVHILERLTKKSYEGGQRGRKSALCGN